MCCPTWTPRSCGPGNCTKHRRNARRRSRCHRESIVEWYQPANLRHRMPLMNRNRFRQLPAVNEVLDVPSLQESLAKHGREAVVTAIRHEIDHARELIASGDVAERDLQPEALAQCVAAHLGHD